MARRRRIISLAIAAALTLTHTPAVHAQFGGVVYDPVSYTHLTLPTTPYV